ncbi:hypothetical protein [Polynucleobacter necessarius]|uniref:hypothetical protein n=1 Tax=Polynucleobacter necessarius TaxID=576610 RepID=UPI0013B05217|nr:hypothetical protein [Polynucleobacter necessarius]
MQPQTTQTYEMGGSWSAWNSKITSSIFKSMTQNEISYNPSTGYNYNSIYQTNRGGILFDISPNLSPSFFIGAGEVNTKNHIMQMVPILEMLSPSSLTPYSTLEQIILLLAIGLLVV